MGIGIGGPIKEQIFNSKGSIFIMHIIFLSQVGKLLFHTIFMAKYESISPYDQAKMTTSSEDI